MMVYVSELVGIVFGLYFLVAGLWLLGAPILPADGILKAAPRTVRLVAVALGLFSLACAVVVLREFSSFDVITVLSILAIGATLWSAISLFRTGKLTLFDIYPRTRGKGWLFVLFGIFWLLPHVGRAFLLLANGGTLS